jgi:hypothetical protein
MANPVVFTISIFCHLHGVQLWTPTTHLPLHRVPILMSTDCPMLSTGCWHTNNHITITTKHRHAPKKHIHKKHILLASIVNQVGDGGSAGRSSAASEVELLSVPQSSISYLINIQTGISPTQLHNTPRISEQLSSYYSDCLAWSLMVVEGGGQQREAGQQC